MNDNKRNQFAVELTSLINLVRAKRSKMNDVIKTCTFCGTPITRGEWEGLPLLGRMGLTDEQDLELRNHLPCFSTLGVAVPVEVRNGP
jgi:hypothetical protein